jgi:asparagine synthase (glutamine-hydrolysing)
MWQKDVSSAAAQSALVYTQSTNMISLECYFDAPCDVFENDSVIMMKLGRVRRYSQDYQSSTQLEWLADLWLQADSPEHFYQQIAGFFALVIMNKRSGTVQLVTDHVGSVPLYFCQSGTQWWLSDRLKHPRAAKKALSAQALYDYFFFHCIPSEQSVLQETYKTGPGMLYNLSYSNNFTRQNLYCPSYHYSADTTEQLRRQCKQVIETAVARNSEQHSAAFLSGGLDSSTVAGFLSRNQPHARTFSIGFDAKGYDETEYALITAKHFNTDHRVHYLQPEEIIENFVAVAGYFDEPFGNSSAMAAYICADVAKKHGVEVMLAGDGGDEIFAGNERYAKQKVFQHFVDLPAAAQSLLEVITKSPVGALPLFGKARSYVNQAKIPLPDRLDTYNFLNRFSPEEMFCPNFLAQVDQQLPAAAKRQRYAECKAAHPVEKMMYLDWKFTLADNDLVKVSTMCHKAGVAVRYPLFEKEVVDFSCTVPADIKLPGNKLRDFYKSSFKGFLADETLVKSKHGFGLPFGFWMKEQIALQQLTKQSLDALKKRSILQPAFVDDAYRIYQSGHAGYYGELIWIMVVLELWLQQRELHH